MGLSTEEAGGKSRVFVKVKMGKQGEAPKLSQTGKVDGQWQEVAKFHQAQGEIKSVQAKSDDGKFGFKAYVEVVLAEPMEDDVQVEIPISGSTTGGVNALLSCKIGDFVRIQPGFRKKGAESYKNLWVSNREGKAISWAYSFSQMPEVKRVEVNGTTIPDQKARLEWFIQKFNDKFSQPKEAAEQPAPVANDDSGLPF